MSGPTTFSYTPNKEMSSGTGQRKEVYYAAWVCHRKRKGSKHFNTFSGYKYEFLV
jgi:hypothetical protein